VRPITQPFKIGPTTAASVPATYHSPVYVPREVSEGEASTIIGRLLTFTGDQATPPTVNRPTMAGTVGVKKTTASNVVRLSGQQ